MISGVNAQTIGLCKTWLLIHCYNSCNQFAKPPCNINFSPFPAACSVFFYTFHPVLVLGSLFSLLPCSFYSALLYYPPHISFNFGYTYHFSVMKMLDLHQVAASEEYTEVCKDLFPSGLNRKLGQIHQQPGHS